MPSLEPQNVHVKKGSFWQSRSSIEKVATQIKNPKKNQLSKISFVGKLLPRQKSTSLSLETSPATSTDMIKLSTVNVHGIYMPPSPSDEFDRYLQQQQQDNSHMSSCDKKFILCTERGSPFTPSTRL